MFVGLFGPWLSKGYDSYGGINLETGKLDLQYHMIYYLSPVRAEKVVDGAMVESAWFASTGLLISALLVTASAILNPIRFKKMYFNFIPHILAFFGISMFFLSIGMGQSIGVVTELEWGVYLTSLAAFSGFIYYVYELLKNPSIYPRT
jgi:hypothetical protein